MTLRDFGQSWYKYKGTVAPVSSSQACQPFLCNMKWFDIDGQNRRQYTIPSSHISLSYLSVISIWCHFMLRVEWKWRQITTWLAWKSPRIDLMILIGGWVLFFFRNVDVHLFDQNVLFYTWLRTWYREISVQNINSQKVINTTQNAQ